MTEEFTPEELREVIRAARVFSHGFSEEQFQNLCELESRLRDSGYLETVRGLVVLEQENGIRCTEALNAYKEILGRKAKVNQEMPELELKLQSLKDGIRHVAERHRQLNAAITNAERELAKVTAQREEEEKELAAFRKRAEAEKERIDKEVEECGQKANVSREDVATAAQIKAEVESHGFSLELMLGLSQEFAGHEKAREELAEGLKKYGSLTKYLQELTDWKEKRETAVKSEVTSLESKRTKLDESCRHLETVLSQLQADTAAEERLRRFYRRYQGVSRLMDYLAEWNQVFFLRCNNPFYALTGAFDRNSGNARFWTDRPPAMCPHCGYRQLLFDEKPYEALDLSVGVSFKLRLEE